MPQTPPAALPGLTLVLLVRNESHHLAQTLTTIEASLPSDRPWEVRIVDGESTDGSKAIASAWCQEDPERRILMSNAKQTTPWAMAVGLQAARYPYVSFLGAHTHYPSGYFGHMAGILDTSSHAAAGSRNRVVPTEGSSWARAIALASDHWVGVGRAPHRHRASPGPAQTVSIPVYRKEWLERIGGIPTDLERSQDFEVNRRIRMAGGVLWLDPDWLCTHFARPTLSRFVRYRVQTGYWPLYASRFGARAFSIRHLAPGAALVTLWLLLTLSTWFDWAAVAVASGFLSYAALVIGASVHSAWRKQDVGLAWRAPLVMAIGHCSYAVGTIAAAVNWFAPRAAGPTEAKAGL